MIVRNLFSNENGGGGWVNSCSTMHTSCSFIYTYSVLVRSPGETACSFPRPNLPCSRNQAMHLCGYLFCVSISLYFNKYGIGQFHKKQELKKMTKTIFSLGAA